MCTVLLPLGVNPTAVNKYIDINFVFDRLSRLFPNFNPETRHHWQFPRDLLSPAREMTECYFDGPLRPLSTPLTFLQLLSSPHNSKMTS